MDTTAPTTASPHLHIDRQPAAVPMADSRIFTAWLGALVRFRMDGEPVPKSGLASFGRYRREIGIVRDILNEAERAQEPGS